MYFILVKYTEPLNPVTALLSFSGAGGSQRHISLYHIFKALFFRVSFMPVDLSAFFFFFLWEQGLHSYCSWIEAKFWSNS